MTDDKALELYEQCDRELPDRGDLGSFKRLIGAFARAALATPPAASLAPVAYLNDMGTEQKLSFVPIEGAYEYRALALCDAAPTPSTPAPLVFDDWFELYMADKAEADRDLERRAAIAGWIAAHEHWSKASTPAPVAIYQVMTVENTWDDTDWMTYDSAASDRRIVYAAPPTRPDVGDARDVEFGKNAEFWKQRHDQKEADCVRLVNEKMDSWEKGFLLGCSLYLKDAKRYTYIKRNARSGSIGFSGQWIGTDDFEGQLDSLVDDLILSQEKDAMLAPQSSEKEDQVIAAKQQGDA